MKIARDFFANSPEDQHWLLRNTWCDTCDAADLGMTDPAEYEEDGHVFVEGRCAKCRGIVRSEVIIKERNP